MSENRAPSSEAMMTNETFLELGISAPLISALAAQTITSPTAIQSASIARILANEDVYLLAETGSGKTLAYLLPLLCRIDPQLPNVQIVIIAPTYELAIQIQRVCIDLTQKSGLALRTQLLIGGTSKERQLEKLKEKPQVVVGTCGRIMELIAAGKLKMHKVYAIVLDEVDRLLQEEKLSDIQAIVKAAPGRRQIIAVSATQRRESDQALKLIAPNMAMVGGCNAAISPTIDHYYMICEERDKPDLARRLLHSFEVERAIIFTHRNETAEIVAAKLAHHKFPAIDLHGSIDKEERKFAMDNFRSGKIKALIASDLAARGLDIKGVSHIINLDAPTESKAYLHRVGRTGRAGQRGVAVSLFCENQLRIAKRYQEDLGIKMTQIFLRNGEVLIKQGGEAAADGIHREA